MNARYQSKFCKEKAPSLKIDNTLIKNAWKFTLSKEALLSELEPILFRLNKEYGNSKKQIFPILLYFISKNIPINVIQEDTKTRILSCFFELANSLNIFYLIPVINDLITLPFLNFDDLFSKKFKRFYESELSALLLQSGIMKEKSISLLVALKAEKNISHKMTFVSICCKKHNKYDNFVSQLIKIMNRTTTVFSLFLSAQSSKAADRFIRLKKSLTKLDSLSKNILNQIIVSLELSSLKSINGFAFARLAEIDSHFLDSLKSLKKYFLPVYCALKRFLGLLCDLLLNLIMGFRSSSTLILCFIFEKELVNRGLVSTVGGMIRAIVYSDNSLSAKTANSEEIKLLIKHLQVLVLLSHSRDPKVVEQFIQMKILLLVKQTDQFLGPLNSGSDLCQEILRNILSKLQRSELKNPLVMNLLNYLYLRED